MARRAGKSGVTQPNPNDVAKLLQKQERDGGTS
jgi:hypothetical protein